jgi:hypothetical protein
MYSYNPMLRVNPRSLPFLTYKNKRAARLMDTVMAAVIDITTSALGKEDFPKQTLSRPYPKYLGAVMEIEKQKMDVLSNIRTYSDAMDVQPRLVTCLRNAKQDTLGDFVDLSEQGESVTQGY